MTAMVSFAPGTSYLETNDNGLVLRFQELSPCGDPLCDCRIHPIYSVFAKSITGDRWLCAFNHPEPEPEPEAARHFDSDRMAAWTLSAAELLGVEWQTLGPDPLAVFALQTEAMRRLPVEVLMGETDTVALRRWIVDIGHGYRVDHLVEHDATINPLVVAELVGRCYTIAYEHVN